MHSEGSNAYYANSSAILSGKLCQLFSLGPPLLDQSKSSPFLSHTVTTVMMAFRQTLMSHKQCQIDIKWVTNVYCHQSVVCLVADIKKYSESSLNPFLVLINIFFSINYISDLLINNEIAGDYNQLPKFLLCISYVCSDIYSRVCVLSLLKYW